jgi:predicted dehydrogenase
MSDLNVLVVGLGSIGRRHTRLLKEMADVQVSVVEPVQANIDRAVSEAGPVNIYPTLEEALKHPFDIVMIATPHTMHTAQTVQCLEAGCNVFCEKPMSDTLEGAAVMMNAARRSGKLLGIAYMQHFNPMVRKMKENIEKNVYGNILHFSSNVGTYITLMNSVSRHQLTTTGSIYMDNIHDLDLLCWFLGKLPSSVHATGIKAGDLELTSDPNISDVEIEFDGSMLANIHFDYVQFPQVHTNHIVGDKAWGEIDYQTNKFSVGRLGGEVTEEIVPIERDDLYRNEWKSFIDVVKNGGALSSPPEGAIIPTLLTEAIITSYLEKRRVTIKEILDKYQISL